MELVDSIHAQNAPPHRAEMRDESAKSKEKPPNCTTFVVQFVPGLLTTLLSSENTPGIAYGALAMILLLLFLQKQSLNSESVEAEEYTS